METRHQLKGIELRYALTMYLLQHGPTTVDELIKALEWQGFDIGGRASKQGVGCAALGETARQGPSTRTGPVRSWVRTARHGVPDLPPRDGLTRRGETLVVQGNPAVDLFVARYAGNFINAPHPPTGRNTLRILSA
jgi:hypothetical protein